MAEKVKILREEDCITKEYGWRRQTLTVSFYDTERGIQVERYDENLGYGSSILVNLLTTEQIKELEKIKASDDNLSSGDTIYGENVQKATIAFDKFKDLVALVSLHDTDTLTCKYTPPYTPPLSFMKCKPAQYGGIEALERLSTLLYTKKWEKFLSRLYTEIKVLPTP